MMSLTVTGIVPSCHLAMLRLYAVWHRVVGRPGTVAMPWEWPAARHCTVVTEQSSINTSCWHLMCRLHNAPRAIMTPSLPTRVAGTLVTCWYTSIACESFFIYCSWPTEGHDTHASPEPLCAEQLGPKLSATWWLLSSLAGLLCDTRRLWSPSRVRVTSRANEHMVVLSPLTWGAKIQSCKTHGDVWMLALRLILTWSLYTRYPICRVPTSTFISFT
jgi:hypothetical protein